MSQLLRPQDLLSISSDAEMAKMEEERQTREKKRAQQRHLRDAFMLRQIQPEAIDRINEAVRIAAERGEHQLQVLIFPASYCNDGGRRINTMDSTWPESLEGFAKQAFEFYVRELKPLGYKLHADIVSFPGGMPGDVGLFLKW